MEILRKLVAVGAVGCNVEESRAIALLERLTGTTKPGDNKEFFYSLCSTLGQSAGTKYTTARANKLRIRLKTYSKDDMLKAATAIAGNAYMMGDSGRKYGTIDYLIRGDEKLDEWLQNGEAVKAQKDKAASRYNTPANAFPAIVPESRRASPEAVAEAKRKLMEKMSRR
ncbi:MAG: hypothetical protein ACOH18_05470 [Candidatus Saccharimonadaceae bacterium]